MREASLFGTFDLHGIQLNALELCSVFPSARNQARGFALKIKESTFRYSLLGSMFSCLVILYALEHRRLSYATK